MSRDYLKLPDNVDTVPEWAAAIEAMMNLAGLYGPDALQEAFNIACAGAIELGPVNEEGEPFYGSDEFE